MTLAAHPQQQRGQALSYCASLGQLLQCRQRRGDAVAAYQGRWAVAAEESGWLSRDR